MKEKSEIKLPLLEIKETGIVKDVKKGIANVEGFPSCVYGQLVQFSSGCKGIVMGFNPSEVLIVILGLEGEVSVGDTASFLTELISVGVGENYLGRIVNSLAEPIDGKGKIKPAEHLPVFREAAGVMERQPITESLCTGTKILDLVIPIGKGQRELIIGDKQTGKSTLGIDAIINQKGRDVICIYCWIGGPATALKKILSILNEKKALDYTIFVVATADAPAAEQYIVPYTAASLGEYFMNKGKDVLVIFDDLTKHAWVYRQMSLLLERSPGREAYPGDVFYLHSQLMERAGKLNDEKGAGSMTFLPIVETLQGDITGYIQSNLVSMTDGQIYINTSLFREGFKPAIDLGLSVSRLGSKVQCQAIKEVGTGLRLEYAQHMEMLRLTKLRTRLSEEALAKMRRGQALRGILVQPNNQPISTEEEIILFYAFKSKVLELATPGGLKRFIEEFFEYISSQNPDLIRQLKETRDLTSDIKDALNESFTNFFRKIKTEEEKGTQ